LYELVRGEWLGLQSQELSLGGNNGESTPTDLGYKLTAFDGSSVCSVDKDPWPTKHDNSLSALGASEMIRRIALHREIDSSLRFPGNTWADIQNELYGAEKSVFFPGQLWGGMTADPSIFLQSALDMTVCNNFSTMFSLASDFSCVRLKTVEADANGQWRIFSKLGNGYSTDRYKGEIINNAYACLPKYVVMCFF
jgi:hypothetical protein